VVRGKKAEKTLREEGWFVPQRVTGRNLGRGKSKGGRVNALEEIFPRPIWLVRTPERGKET